MKVRRAIDADILRGHGNVIQPILVSFYYNYGSSRRNFQGCGFRKPFKKNDVWLVRRYSDAPLLVDETDSRTNFVISM